MSQPLLLIDGAAGLTSVTRSKDGALEASSVLLRSGPVVDEGLVEELSSSLAAVLNTAETSVAVFSPGGVVGAELVLATSKAVGVRSEISDHSHFVARLVGDFPLLEDGADGSNRSDRKLILT